MNVTNEIREDSIVLGDELEGQQFAVKSDAAFFDVLSNSLYSMPKLAVVRETITNAVDAHKEAGTNEPVEVKYSYSDNLLIVSDKGHGIPHDKIHEIYCTYGNSTKKNNDSTGGFGLGCKSPFAVTNSFTVTNSNNGVRKTYILDKKNGIPEIISIKKGKEDSQSGLTVTIPFTNNKEDLSKQIRAFVFYAGINVKLNDQQLETVNYTKEGMYYVHPYGAGVNSSTLGLYSYGSTFIVRYGCNLYNFDLHDAKASQDLENLYKEWENLLKDIYVNNIKEFSSSLYYATDSILNVSANSLDITPNRESLRYTPKTITTITQLLQKEVDRLKEGINTKKWLDLYQSNRLGVFLEVDNFVPLFQKNHCITAEDIISQKKNKELKLCTKDIYKEVFIEHKGIFTKEDKDFISFLLNTYSTVYERTKGYYNFSDDEVVQEICKRLIAFETPLTEALNKQGIKSFSIGSYTYSITGYNYKELCSVFHGDMYQKSNVFKRIYKVVVISNYKSCTKDSPIHTALYEQYPDYNGKDIFAYAYRVQLLSKRKADKLQAELESKGYYVLNLVKEREKTVNSNSCKAIELIRNVDNRDTCYYVTKKSLAAFSHYLTNNSYVSLSYCFAHSLSPTNALKLLPRYHSYEVIEVPHTNLVSVIKKHHIRSLEEILFADVKQLLQENPSLRLAYSLLYYSSHNNYLGNSLKLEPLLWFVLQSPELCKVYNLPELTEEDLKKICLIKSFYNGFSSYRQSIVDLLITTGRVQKFIKVLYDNCTFNNEYTGLIDYAVNTIQQAQEKHNPRALALVNSILDSFLISAEETNNEQADNQNCNGAA